MTMNVVEKYLSQYGEPEVSTLTEFPAGCNFQHVVVIPAYKEPPAFIDSICTSTLLKQGILLILVINQPDTDNNKAPQQALVTATHRYGQILWHKKNLTLTSIANTTSAILIVDRFSVPIPFKQGVGLARKVGADIASYLIQEKRIEKTWIHSTDADASLPENYFTAVDQLSSKVVVATYNFQHYSEDETINDANRLYEQAMRYYVAGLSYAHSHYSFFTIGSLLVFKVKAYAQVRGFPKRSAGEDFYLINKLAKLGQVVFLEKCIVQLQARLSDRVPFGTGPAVEKIIAQNTIGNKYRYYHPEVFVALKEVLGQADTLFAQTNNLQLWLEQFPMLTQNALIAIGFKTFISRQQNVSKAQFDKQFVVWFDAFKTLKFIHFLRDNGLENIDLQRALESAPFIEP
ncbi:hypothetical protein [Thalassotalea sediminis]|uniref:hypothetical protein n=1 Tax=Thalassotalea sediminis TaxID=1759089 RepID=UPI0025744370|nr:hypothetical protein [Thalassotalea sediminis]